VTHVAPSTLRSGPSGGTGGRILRNTLFQTLGLASSRLLGFLITVVIARVFGPGDVGYFAFLTTYAYLWALGIDFGMNPTLTRELAKGDGLRGLYRGFMRLKTVLAAVVLLLGVTIARLVYRLDTSALLWVFVCLVAVAFLSLQSLSFSVFRAREALGYEALVSVASRLLYLVAGVLFVMTIRRVEMFFLAFALSSMLGFWGGWFVVKTRYPDAAESWNLEALRKAFWESCMPLFAVEFFTFVYFRVDILMLQYIRGPEAVGLYAAGYRVIEGLMLFPAAFMAAYFAPLTACDRSERRILVQRALGFLLAGGVGIALMSGLFAEWLMTALYGDPFTAAGPVFRVLSLALFAIFLNYLLTQLCVVLEMQREYGMLAAGCAALNVVLNWFLIPPYGGLGAAWATCITEACILGYLGIRLRNLWVPARVLGMTR